MSAADSGRFCTQCREVVTDIREMSDTAILRLFQYPEELHCIRALPAQLNRIMALPTQEPTRFYRVAIALGLTVAAVSGTNTAARPKAPLTEQYFSLPVSENNENEISYTGGSLTVNGIVLNAHGSPLRNKTIELSCAGNRHRTVTDRYGIFCIDLAVTPASAANDALPLSVFVAGYEQKTIDPLYKDLNAGVCLEIRLEVKNYEEDYSIMGRGLNNLYKSSQYDAEPEKDSLGRLTR